MKLKEWHQPCLSTKEHMHNILERQDARTLRPSRSGQMVECLRENLLYSEKRARDILFIAIEKALARSGDTTQMLCTLTREAARIARRDADAVGFEFSNWDITTKAVIGAMLGAGVFISHDGSPVPVGVAAQAYRDFWVKRRLPEFDRSVSDRISHSFCSLHLSYKSAYGGVIAGFTSNENCGHSGSAVASGVREHAERATYFRAHDYERHHVQRNGGTAILLSDYGHQ
jgi:hypothetical protein